jgi:hypothetical protein
MLRKPNYARTSSHRVATDYLNKNAFFIKDRQKK